MLQVLRHREIIEDQQENKKIVYAERQFENVARDEFQRWLWPLPEVEDGSESGGHRDVYRAPTERPTKTYNVTGPVEDAKVDHQQGERENVEQYPEVEQAIPSGLRGIVER